MLPLLFVLSVLDGGVSTPRDVSRAFLEIPSVPFGSVGSAERQAALEQADVDVPNGYLERRWEPAPNRGWHEFQCAVFRRKNGTSLVGLKLDEARFPPSAALWFVELRDGVWSDITKEVLPANATDGLWDRVECPRCETGLRWALPREGTTLKATSFVIRNHGEHEVETIGLVWNRELGVFQRPKPRRK